MLTIRDAQLAAFRGEASQRFDQRLQVALARSFPRDHARLGDEPLRAIVRQGRALAGRHGWRSGQSVYLCLTLVLMFGIGFDTDPQLPWVQQALAADPAADAEARLLALHALALDQLDAVEGVHNEHLVKALLRERELDLARFEPPEGARYEAHIAAVLAGLHPRKAAALGEDGLLASARAAAAQASAHGLRRARAHGLVALLRFMLGHRFDDDPAHPWAAAALALPGTETQRVQALHQAALGLLRHGLG